MSSGKKKSDNDLVSNRKARHEFEILETFEAGMVLVGTEIKSLRDHAGSLQEAYIRIVKNVPTLIGAFIAHYKFGNIYNHEERRDRTLLLHKKEIETLKRAQEQKGLTIVPLSIYLKKGFAKVKLGIARGKKLHDKREAIKERDQKRMIEKMVKES